MARGGAGGAAADVCGMDGAAESVQPADAKTTPATRRIAAQPVVRVPGDEPAGTTVGVSGGLNGSHFRQRIGELGN